MDKHKWGWFLQSKLPYTVILDDDTMDKHKWAWFLQSKLPYTGILDEKL